MSKNGGGKSLKGLGSLSAKFLGPIEAAINASISSGGVEFTNITIAGGTIDGVVIGDNQPGPGIFTTLQSGNPTGVGYTVCFFGLQVGKSACWLPVRGAWDIKGDLLVNGVSELGNLNISSNTISASNLNGNINLSVNGSGIVNVNGGILQNSTSGDVNFNSDTGEFGVSSGNIALRSKEGDVVIESGTTLATTTITSATSNSGIATITTSGANPYSVGTGVKIVADGITGYYIVATTPTATTFTVNLLPGVSIIAPLTTGTVTRRSDVTIETPHVVNINSESVVIDGNLTVKGTTTTVESITLSVVDPVISTGTGAVSDGKDRGISSNYFNVSEKTSFFGRSAATGCFTYIPDATETVKDVFTGAPGCARFSNITLDSVTLTSGNIDLCNITCSSAFTVTSGSSISLLSPDLSTSSNFLYLNSPSTIMDKGITFNYLDGSIKTGFSGFDASAQSFVFLTNTTNNAGVITGTPAPLSAGNTTVSGDLIITGNLIGGNVAAGQPTLERLTLTVTPTAPSPNINITFVSVNTVSSILTSTLTAPILDGFVKDIVMSNLATGAQYRLFCPLGLLIDPGSGSTAAKTLKFTTTGQSANLVWDAVRSAYFIRNAGCCIE